MLSRATYRQVISSSMALMASFVYGCKVGFIESTTPMLMSPTPPINATRNDISWMASISHVGSLLGIVLCYTLTNKISCRTFILGITTTFAISWLCILTTSSMETIIVCMFLYGVASNVLNATANIYFAEIATPRSREFLLLCYPVTSAVGILTENLLARYNNYKLLAAFPLSISIITIVLSLCMIESPYYLVSKGEKDLAVKNLRWLHNKDDDEDVTVGFDEIKNYVEEQRGIAVSDFKAMFIAENLKLLGALILIGIPLSINCGAVIYSYGPIIFQNLETYVDGETFMDIYSAIRTLCTVLGIITVKKFRRRVLIIYGMMSVALIELGCCFCFYLERKFNYELQSAAKMIEFSLYLRELVFATTISSAFTVLRNEVLPHRLKEFYSSLLGFKSDLLSFLVTKSYFWLSNALGIDYLLLIYSSFYLVGLPCAYFFVRDTKGKSLSQIRTDYGSTAKSKS